MDFGDPGAVACAKPFTHDSSRYLNCPSNLIGHDHPNKPANGVGNSGTFHQVDRGRASKSAVADLAKQVAELG
jgi:hypothetical protein